MPTQSSWRSRGPSGRLSVERRRGRDCSRGGFAKELGFAPVKLGKLNEGGALVHARGRIWGPLIFQDLFKEKQYSIYGRVIWHEKYHSKMSDSIGQALM